MEPSEPENNKSLDVAEQRTGFVIIPFNYDQLPESQQRKMIVPICIASVDRHGNPIAPIWFEKGVAPVQEQLRRIAQSMLGDIRRVSELAEITTHRLWERHGQDAGRRPSRRVVKRAMWVARDLAAGANWWQIDRTVSLALDSLEGDLNGSNGCEELYQQHCCSILWNGGSSKTGARRSGMFSRCYGKATPGTKSRNALVTQARRHSRNGSGDG